MRAATTGPEGQASLASLPSSGQECSCQSETSDNHGFLKSRSEPCSQCTPQLRTPTKDKRPVLGRQAGLQCGQLETPVAQCPLPLELERPLDMQKAEETIPEKNTLNVSGKGKAKSSGSKMRLLPFTERKSNFSRGTSRTPEPPSPVKAPSSHSSFQCLQILLKDKNSSGLSWLKLSSAVPAAADGIAQLVTPARSQEPPRTPATGFTSRSSLLYAKNTPLQSSTSKDTGTPKLVRKFKEDPGLFKQRLTLSDSEDSDCNAGDPSKQSSPPKGSFLESLANEKNALKVAPSSQKRNGAHPRQQQQPLSKSLAAPRPCAPGQPLLGTSAGPGGRQRNPQNLNQKPSSIPAKKQLLSTAQDSGRREQPVARDLKQGSAVVEVRSGSLHDAGKVPPGSCKRSLYSLLQEVETPAESCYVEINGKLYQVLNIIGRGGSSKVFMMVTPHKKLCAVKLVSLARAQPEVVDTFMNEVAILKSLGDCERVVRLYDFEYHRRDRVLALVMEKGDEDLAGVLTSSVKDGSLSAVSVKFYWSEMLLAVQEIHAKGIIHSDLKPANFLFVHGKLKLIDFGIASTMKEDVTSVMKESPMGTLNFMSPESLQLCDQEGGKHCLKISQKSDVWSLGCILYHLVYGKTPFQHVVPSEAKMLAITGESYTIRFPDISDPNLLDVLKKCLRRNPRQRPTISELLQHPYLAPEKTRQRNPVLESVLSDIENMSPASVSKLSRMIKYLRDSKK